MQKPKRVQKREASDVGQAQTWTTPQVTAIAQGVTLAGGHVEVYLHHSPRLHRLCLTEEQEQLKVQLQRWQLVLCKVLPSDLHTSMVEW